MRAFIAVLLFASTASAQQWSVDAQGGRIRSSLDPSARATESFVAGLRYDDALTAFRVSGGIPKQSSDALWGSIAAARRLAVRQNKFMFGVDVAGNTFTLHDRVERTRQIPGTGGLFGAPAQTVPAPSLSGSAFSVQALPLIGYEGANIQGFIRAGVSHYTSQFADNKRTRDVQLGEAQLTIAAAPTFALIPSAKIYHAKEGNFKYAGATAITSSGRLSAWGSVGSWLGQDSNAVAWGAGASLRMHRNASINLSTRHDAIDPLYMTPPQTSWSAGVSLHVGGAPQPSAPIPAKYEAGKATVRLPTSSSKAAPSIAGDFNNWKPQSMQRDGKVWTFTMAVKPGVYNFSFVDAAGNWFVPEKYPGRKADGMGGYVAVLVVQ
ncbi:MAG TPA: glycogen-binding domain-containing protein [Longimicrobiales bacterium]|nr:glycogen-binding domain-containing protein [Longimicrobiales bacterium]